MIDRKEINKLIRTMPLDQVSELVERYRGALEKHRRRGGDTTQTAALLDHVAEVLEYVDQAETVLAQGVDMYLGTDRSGASQSRV